MLLKPFGVSTFVVVVHFLKDAQTKFINDADEITPNLLDVFSGPECDDSDNVDIFCNLFG